MGVLRSSLAYGTSRGGSTLASSGLGFGVLPRWPDSIILPSPDPKEIEGTTSVDLNDV